MFPLICRKSWRRLALKSLKISTSDVILTEETMNRMAVAHTRDDYQRWSHLRWGLQHLSIVGAWRCRIMWVGLQFWWANMNVLVDRLGRTSLYQILCRVQIWLACANNVDVCRGFYKTAESVSENWKQLRDVPLQVQLLVMTKMKQMGRMMFHRV